MADPVTLGVLIAGAGVAATAVGSIGTVAATAYDVHKERRRKRKEKKQEQQIAAPSNIENYEWTTEAATTPPFQHAMPLSPNGTPIYTGCINPGQSQGQPGYFVTTQTVTYRPANPQNGQAVPTLGYAQQSMGYVTEYPQQPFEYGTPVQAMQSVYANPGPFGSTSGGLVQDQQYPGQAVHQAPLAIMYNVPPPKYEVAKLDLKKGRFLSR